MTEQEALRAALAVAVQEMDVWVRVACWNGSQKVPYRAVADVLNEAQDERASRSARESQ